MIIKIHGAKIKDRICNKRKAILGLSEMACGFLKLCYQFNFSSLKFLIPEADFIDKK